MSYDSPRLEAAMKALREDQHHPFRAAPRRAATLALNAADAITFSEEAIERAAKAIHNAGAFAHSWEERGEGVKDLYREDVRIIIAALKGDNSVQPNITATTA